MLSIDQIVRMNALFNQYGVLKPEQMESAYASLSYYASPLLKAIVVTRAIILSHPFVDGNKRTALMALLVDAEYNKIHMRQMSEDCWAQLMLDIANDKLSVEQIARRVS